MKIIVMITIAIYFRTATRIRNYASAYSHITTRLMKTSSTSSLSSRTSLPIRKSTKHLSFLYDHDHGVPPPLSSLSSRQERNGRFKIKSHNNDDDFPPEITVLDDGNKGNNKNYNDDDDDEFFDANKSVGIDWSDDNSDIYAAWDDEQSQKEENDRQANRRGGGGGKRYESRPNEFAFGGGGGGGVGGYNNRKQVTNAAIKKGKRNKKANSSSNGGDDKVASYRDDFRGTRVFVQGLPLDTTWQTLKDHFRLAGSVIFASISVNPDGSSKGHGIVQYETTTDAQNAIAIMRDHPLDGSTLFVRPDYQEKTSSDVRSSFDRPEKRRTTVWKCGNDANTDTLSPTDKKCIESIIRARDASRRRRNYDASDAMREELKQKYDVHVDDRLKMWWSAADDAVPDRIRDMKGDGGWDRDKARRPWRQIPTTEENDACVDSDLVEGLLKRRDAARLEKDWTMADGLLEEARTCPEGELTLRVHDESRTWRVWTSEPPPSRVVEVRVGPVEQCLALVGERDPEKVGEVKMLLKKFPGREYNILKKLKQRYNLMDEGEKEDGNYD